MKEWIVTFFSAYKSVILECAAAQHTEFSYPGSIPACCLQPILYIFLLISVLSVYFFILFQPSVYIHLPNIIKRHGPQNTHLITKIHALSLNSHILLSWHLHVFISIFLTESYIFVIGNLFSNSYIEIHQGCLDGLVS